MKTSEIFPSTIKEQTHQPTIKKLVVSIYTWTFSYRMTKNRFYFFTIFFLFREFSFYFYFPLCCIYLAAYASIYVMCRVLCFSSFFFCCFPQMRCVWICEFAGGISCHLHKVFASLPIICICILIIFLFWREGSAEEVEQKKPKVCET